MANEIGTGDPRYGIRKPAQASDIEAYRRQREIQAAAPGLVGAMGTPAAGMVRLFRGEGPLITPLTEATGIWRAPEMLAFTGRWFTPHKATAEQFAKDIGKKGVVKYVDVPRDVAEAAKVAGKPGLEQFSFGLKDSYILPTEWAERAVPVTP